MHVRSAVGSALAILVLAALGPAGHAVVESSEPVGDPTVDRGRTAGAAPHRLAFTSHDRTQLRVAAVGVAQATLVFASTSSIQTVALSSDGTEVAWLFYGNEDISSDRIMVRRVGADEPTRNVLARFPHRFDWVDVVAWSPDDRRIAFVARGTNGRTHLWTIRRSGRGLHLVRRNPGHCPDNCARLIWSPDGSRIAWFSEDDGGWRAITLESGRVVRLHDRFIGWLRGGRRIAAAVGSYDSDKRLVTMLPDGSRRQEVLRDVPLWGDGPFEATVGKGDTVLLLWETPENDDPEYYTSISLADGTTVPVRRDLDPDTGDAFDWR